MAPNQNANVNSVLHVLTFLVQALALVLTILPVFTPITPVNLLMCRAEELLLSEAIRRTHDAETVTTATTTTATDFSSQGDGDDLENIDLENIDVDVDLDLDLEWYNYYGSDSSCHSFESCENCTNTYTCHWCTKTDSCHARGSMYGCAFGGTCQSNPPPTPPKENTTCAAQDTCQDCTVSSRLCHWCEVDNACHAIGSRYGCTIGVDCYSNDRCRRTEPEPLPPAAPSLLIEAWNRIPTTGLIGIGMVGLISILCVCCCQYCCTANIIGAYDDLTETIAIYSATASRSQSPPFSSIIGTTTQPSLDEPLLPPPPPPSPPSSPDEGEDEEEDDNTNSNEASTMDEEQQHQSVSSAEENSPQLQQYQQQQQQQQEQQQNQLQEQSSTNGGQEGTDNNYNFVNRYQIIADNNQQHGSTLLLHPSFRTNNNERSSITNSTATGGGGEREREQQHRPVLYRHMKNLQRCCSRMYYVSICAVLVIMGLTIVYFPQIPVYNICNNEVAWTKIMKSIIGFKLDASFEILATIKNPNRLGTFVLDNGQCYGTFEYGGKQLGTYTIPGPVRIAPNTITDFMILVRVSPADKTQALQLVEAYYRNELIIEASFTGTIRIPSFGDYTRTVSTTNIVVDVNALSDRSLCQCPTWNDDKNHSVSSLSSSASSSSSFFQLMDEHWSHHHQQQQHNTTITNN